ncbi:MAG: SRPBCC domain-containing protein [Marmoricola sp.]
MAMQLTHDFTVPASLDETWAAFNDIEGVAGCFPGATVTGAEGDSFEGTCKVKLGPIALVYKGAGAFVEKDRDGGRMKIEAKGKDKRGNGTAGADVTATMVEEGGNTRVTVVTDLNITGKPAQFGRGVMQDVSDKLLAQFVDCLSQRLSQPEAEANAAAADDQDAGPASQPTGAAAGTPSTDAAGDPDAGPASAPPADAVPLRSQPTRHPASDDALDLGAAVLPVLLKSYWKQGAGVLGALALLALLLRRRRR